MLIKLAEEVVQDIPISMTTTFYNLHYHGNQASVTSYVHTTAAKENCKPAFPVRFAA